MTRDHVCASVAGPVRPPTGADESSTSNLASRTFASNIPPPSATQVSKHVNPISNVRAGSRGGWNGATPAPPKKTEDNGVFRTKRTCLSVTAVSCPVPSLEP